MATFRLLQFSAPHTLRAIDQARLLAFLRPHQAFFRNRRVELPADGSADPIPFDRLIGVFMSPDRDTPGDLIDALHYVDSMATPEGMHTLLEAARAADVPIDGGGAVTPADVAVQLWLLAPDLLERKQAEQYLTSPRSFEYFQTDEDPPPPTLTPAPPALAALEHELNDWFDDHRRGRTARVFAFDRPDGAWFLVRHGEPYKREESAEGADQGSVAYRPLRYDVVAYDPRPGELRVHAQLKGEKDLYRRAFGRHLFGRADFFPDGVKYTLEPLRADGEASLRCTDVDGIEWVRLREVHYAWGGVHGEYHTVRANDVFAAQRDRGSRGLAQFPRLARAVFQVKFRACRRPRAVTIKPPNVALYTRDADAGLVEGWLERRGFLNVKPDAAAAHPPLASA